VTAPPPRAPRSTSEHSRRALLCVISEVLAAQWDALTLVGAHAVMLRTDGLELSQGATGDGDLGTRAWPESCDRSIARFQT
jgi:hypothetical protein